MQKLMTVSVKRSVHVRINGPVVCQLEETRTMDYATNHNMITMATSIFKTLKMRGNVGVNILFALF